MGKRDINAFRERFNRWKNGELVYDNGRPITDAQYTEIMERVAEENNPVWNLWRKQEGGDTLTVDLDLFRILNDNTYDYRGYYNKYPNSRANADTHWTDEFKTAYHPTFSTYSKYSGKKSQYNPEGVLGGHWDGEKYIPAWGLKLPSYYKTYSNGKDAGTITAPVLSVKAGDTVNTELCAEWANKWLRDNGYITYGNAWNLKNVDVLYNGYKGMKKPAEYDRKAIERYNHAAADSVYKNFDSTTLDKSKPYSVNMFYNGSPAQEKAYEQGDNVTGTHTGLLTFNPSQNKWYVTHNIHGTIHQDLFVPLQSGKGKYGVTAIYEPRENTTVNKIKGFFGFEDGKEDDRIYDGRTLPEVTVYPTTLSLLTHYPIVSDYFPGHSLLMGYNGNTGDSFGISKRPSNPGYNFVTNNCSDDTRKALEAATGNMIHPFLFTTPGDVLDFFKQQYPDFREYKHNGVTKLTANVSPIEFNNAKEIADSLYTINAKKRKQDIERWQQAAAARNARKWHHN